MQHIKLFLLFSVFFSNLNAQEFVYKWAKSFGGTSTDQCLDVVKDNQGNFIIIGQFQFTTDLDPGISNLNVTSRGNVDAFLIKTDSDGALIWAQHIGGKQLDHINALDVDNDGNIIVTGYFLDSCYFDNNKSIYAFNSGATTQGYLVKYNPNGQVMWVKTYEGNGNIYPKGVAVDALGSCVTVGTYADTADFDPGVSTFNLNSNLSSEDIYITKLDSSGNFIWAKSIGGSSEEDVEDVELDLAGNVYFAGEYKLTCDFDPNVGIVNHTSTGNKDLFITKFDASGSYKWVYTVGGSSALDEQLENIAISDDGKVFGAGVFGNTIDFDPGPSTNNITASGPNDVYIVRLDTSGAYDWAIGYGGVNTETPSSMLTEYGLLYTIGQFSTLSDMDPGLDTFNIAGVSTGAADIYVQVLDTGGNFVWAGSMVGIGNNIGAGICIGQGGNVVGVGSFSHTVDFNPDTSVANSLSSVFSSQDDGYIFNLGICYPNSAVDVVSSCAPFTWIDGITYDADNDTATFVLKTNAGCDSVVTLDLTILSNGSSDQIEACKSQTWIDGITYTSDNNTATQVYTNTDGCDSVVTLNLTINSPDISVTNANPELSANATGLIYQWLDCNDNFAPIIGATNRTYIATANGSFAVELDDQGCIDTSDCQDIVLLEIDQLESNSFSLYPNPGNGNFRVQLPGSNGFIRVLDISGSVVLEQKLNKRHMTIALKSDPGIYIVELRNLQGNIHRMKYVLE